MNRVSTALLAAALGLTTSACGEDENRPIYRSFDQDLVEVAQAQGLTEFLRVADLVGASNGLDIDTGNGTVLTLFAPTDAAFNALDPDVRSNLEANLSVFSKVFRYHALGGNRPATLIEATASVDGSIETVIGEDIAITSPTELAGGPDLSGETTTANITAVDLYAQNGIIHVIDSVLLPPLNIAEVATVAGLSSLVTAATDVELDSALTGPGPLTVFAPTNDAFMALGDLSMVDAGVIANVLLTHVVSGTSTSAAVLAADSFVTLAGTPIEVDEGAGTIGGAALSDTLDVPASNGIVHVLNDVIVPPTILEVAAATAETSTLAQAVGLADPAVAEALDPDTLGGEAPITVFAPTNEAFAALNVDLTTIPTSTLSAVLAHHLVTGPLDDEGMVTEGQLLAADLSDGDELFTATGTLTVGVTDGMVTLTDGSGNTVNVIETDIRTLTGVVHLIDGVLIPATED